MYAGYCSFSMSAALKNGHAKSKQIKHIADLQHDLNDSVLDLDIIGNMLHICFIFVSSVAQCHFENPRHEVRTW